MRHHPVYYFLIFFNLAFLFFILPLIPPAGAQTTPADQALAQIASCLDRIALDNGLVVLIKDDPAAPLVAIQAWIRTGSANEGEDLGGGLSHAMEHMIFKGTPARPPGAIAQAIDATGGAINAYTAGDRTVFSVELPARHWHAGLEVLADALRNAAFPEEEWQREKEVIRREMAMDQDNPDRQLARLLWETAYRVHPYRAPVIGYPDVFGALTRQDLRTFFQRHYAPNNMILALVGDVRAPEAEAAIRERFGDWPRRAGAPAPLPAEPDQIGERLARRTGPYAVTRVAIGWHTVNTAHPDAPALDLLAALAGNGRSSRLAREIKDRRKLAHEISAWSFTPLDPGLFGLQAVCDPGREADLIGALQDEVGRWAGEPFARAELEKARRRLLVETLAQLQTTRGQADSFAAGEFYAGCPFFFRTYLQRLERVAPADLQTAARKYLRAENRTTAVLAPTPAGPPGPRPAPPQPPAGQVEKITLASGVPLLLREDHRLPMVWMTAVCGGGLSLEQASDNGITSLMAELLTRGAGGRPADALARAIESRGASLDAFAGQNSCGLRMEGLARDAPELMQILADCLLAPDFAPEELVRRKPIQLALIRQQRESPFFLAQEALRQALFPEHPYRFAPEGTREAVEALTAGQVRAWHAKTAVRENTVLAVFGDLTSGQARALAEKCFRRFPAGPRPQPAGVFPQPALPRRVRRAEPREQAVLLAGFPGVDLWDPRGDALDLLQQALSGLASELMLAIRDRQGLAYSTGAIQQPGARPGYFALYARTRASALPQVEELMRREILRLTTRGLHPEELERARNKLITEHARRRQLNGELALECALNELYGRGYAYSFEAEQRLQALTAETVREAAASILNTNRMAVSIVAPEKNITK